MKRCRTLALALLVITGLTACGGGGRDVLGAGAQPGASSTPVGPPTSPGGSAQPSAASSAASRGPVPAATGPQATTAGATSGSQQGSVTATTAHPSAAPQATPTTASNSSVLEVSDADNGRTLHVTRGQQIHVRLSNGTYDLPQSDNGQVLARQTTHGGYPSSAPAEATFDAVAAGHAQLSATTDAACLHTQPRCLIAQRTWHVDVIVS